MYTILVSSQLECVRYLGEGRLYKPQLLRLLLIFHHWPVNHQTVKNSKHSITVEVRVISHKQMSGHLIFFNI